MGKINQDFRYHRAFDFIVFIVFILFLALFSKSIITLVGAFEAEVYTNTLAELGRVNN
jgi:hypothetical protein